MSLDFEFRNGGDRSVFKVLNENNLYVEMQENDLNLSMSNLLAILRSDFVIKYDPILEYFKSLPKWDGVIVFCVLNSFMVCYIFLQSSLSSFAHRGVLFLFLVILLVQVN